MSDEKQGKSQYQRMKERIEGLEAELAEARAIVGGDTAELLAENARLRDELRAIGSVPPSTTTTGGVTLKWLYDPEDLGKGDPGGRDEDGNQIGFLTPLYKHKDGLRPRFKRGVSKSDAHFEFAEEYRFANKMSYDAPSLPSLAKSMLDRAFAAAGLRDMQDAGARVENFPQFDPERTFRLTIRVE